MTMKKIFALMLTLSMLLAMTACGGSKDPTPAPEGNEDTVSEGSNAPEYEITMASFDATGTVGGLCGEKFVELVDEASGGRIKINFFQDAVLGSETENMQQIKTGEIHIGKFGDNFGSQIATGIDPTVIPFIFESLDDVKAVYSDETLGAAIAKAAKENNNVYLIGLQDRSPRLLTASKEIATPDQLKGVKVRVPEIDSWVTVWNGMGALSTVVAWSETYSALQTGVVDAQENPIDNIYSNKIFEVNKYIMNTEHLQGLHHWCINADFYDSMDAEAQQILADCLAEAIEWANGELEAMNAQYKEDILADGSVTFVDVDKNVWREAATPGIEKVLAEMDPLAQEYVNNYMAG